MANVRLEKVLRKFKSVVAVDNVDLQVNDREFVVFLGPSGCGKTTTLRSIAGLEKVDGGSIYIGDQDVTSLPPGKRGIGMVFQSYALFPHMTVADNIGFGLKIKRVDRSIIQERVKKVVKLLHLENMLDRYPSQLSGGQRQRVAVARSLVIEPEVLLMDEPLSNLDALLRLEMRAELKKLHHEIRATTIYVTHDQVEALSLGDRIAVMNSGRIVQYDVPIKIYDDPANVFVGSFIGSPPMNFLQGDVVSDNGTVSIKGNGFTVAPPTSLVAQLKNLSQVLVGVRPENIQVIKGESEQPSDARATVRVVELLGDHKLLTVELGEASLKVAVDSGFEIGVDDVISLQWKADKLRFFDPETEWSLTHSA